MQVYHWIDQLIAYGIEKKLIEEEDRIFVQNAILTKLKLEYHESSKPLNEKPINHIEILDHLIHYAYDNGLIESPNPPFSDLFDTALMATMVPRPSVVNQQFFAKYREAPESATDYFYNLSKNSHYIRTDRIAKNLKWDIDSAYGIFNMTVNLSKPEKDPKAIAMAQKQEQTNYPKCLLCYENVGYEGRVNHPARQNHRVIPLTLNQESWYFQYSPYVYFNEHSIVFKKEHEPMKISRTTFVCLLDFIDVFPHYFIGSNADLPIVGGSMLSHDHYQAGRYQFPMARAKEMTSFKVNGFKEIDLIRVHWPMSVLRLCGSEKDKMIELASVITDLWRGYSDDEIGVIAKSHEGLHNTVTPIARKRNDVYEIDLVLRNNRVTEEHPDGLFHPHKAIHPVKKENIGLIEVMGLAVLPSRLVDAMEALEKALILRKGPIMIAEDSSLEPFSEIYTEMQSSYENGQASPKTIVKEVIGKVFIRGLEHAGIFKNTTDGEKAMERFIAKIQAVVDSSVDVSQGRESCI